MPTLILYSDDPTLAVGFREALEDAADLEMVAHATSGVLLQELLRLRQADILLVDFAPGFTLDHLTSVRSMMPQATLILWVHHLSTEMAMRAISLGVRGTISKTMAPPQMLARIRTINRGELGFDKSLTDSLLTAPRYKLSRREGEIIGLVAQGLKNKEVATALDITEGTVKVYLSRLFKKLGVKDRLDLALFGLRDHTTGFSNAASVRPSGPGARIIPIQSAMAPDRQPHCGSQRRF